MYFHSNFKEIYKDTKSLTFMPYKQKLDNEANYNDDDSKNNITAKLNPQGETELKSINGEIYADITKIESENGKTKIHYKSKYGVNVTPIEIIDNKTGEKILSTNEAYDGIEQKENTIYIDNMDEYVVTFNNGLCKKFCVN